MAATALERTIEEAVIGLLKTAIPDLAASVFHANQSADDLDVPRITVEAQSLNEYVTGTGVYRVQVTAILENNAHDVVPDAHDLQWALLVSVFAASTFPSSICSGELFAYPVYRKQTATDRSENSWRNTATVEFCACLNRPVVVPAP